MVAGEAATDIIRNTLYEGREFKDLTEAEKENIIALAQLASGLAVAGSKNAVENNYLAPAIKQAAQIGARACISNNVCRVEVTKQLIYAAATIGISLEVSDIDSDKLQAVIDKIGNQIDLASGVSGIGSIILQSAINHVFSDESSNSQNDNNNASKDPNEIKEVHNSIKDSSKYPKGFRDVQNGTVNNTVKNKPLLEQLRKIEPGRWSKVYKDGYDTAGKEISIHYFRSQSGRVFNVKVKTGWSNL